MDCLALCGKQETLAESALAETFRNPQKDGKKVFHRE